MVTISSKEFDEDASKATTAAQAGPVFITQSGYPTHVLMTMEQYRALVGRKSNIVDLLALPAGVAAADFKASHADGLYRPIHLV